jgi:hypothetical protein
MAPNSWSSGRLALKPLTVDHRSAHTHTRIHARRKYLKNSQKKHSTHTHADARRGMQGGKIVLPTAGASQSTHTHICERRGTHTRTRTHTHSRTSKKSEKFPKHSTHTHADARRGMQGGKIVLPTAGASQSTHTHICERRGTHRRLQHHKLLRPQDRPLWLATHQWGIKECAARQTHRLLAQP